MRLLPSLLSLLLSGAIVSTSASAAQRPPVFGYLSTPTTCTLTLNGQNQVSFQKIPAQLSPILRQDLQILARQLNQIAQQGKFSAAEIQPAMQQGKYVIQYQDQVLLQLKPAWKDYFQRSDLSTLVELTNTLRTQLGAERLQSFASLGNISAHQTGFASWYGGYFHGRLTANGERYNVHRFTAAHKQLPFGTKVLVTNLENQQSVVVKINDRGPFKAQRVIDLSPAAFQEIGYLGQGILRVKLTILS